MSSQQYFLFDEALTVTQLGAADGVAPLDANAKVALTNLYAGTPDGLATLDSAGYVPLAQIPPAVAGGLSYIGTWDSSTNTTNPVIAGGLGNTLTGSNLRVGNFWINTATFAGPILGYSDWRPGDWAVINSYTTGPTVITWGKIDSTNMVDLATEVTGILAVANGGTGVSTLTANGILLGGATVSQVSAGTAGYPLLATAGAPAFGQLTAAGLAPSAVDLTTSVVTGTLPVTKGGTGVATLGTTGSLVVANGVANFTSVADIATGNVLLSGGVGAPPSYGKVNLDSTTGHVTGVLLGANGGTGLANAGMTISLGGNIVTAAAFSTAGASALTLTTTATTNATLPAGTKTLVATDEDTLSSLANVGTIVTGVWNATAIAAVYGGTGITSYTTGDLLTASSGTTLSVIAAGTAGYPLVASGAGVVSTYAQLTAAGLAADAVTTAKILDANVTAAKLAPRTQYSRLDPSYPGAVVSITGNGTSSLLSDPTGAGAGTNKFKNFYVRTAGGGGGGPRVGTIAVRWLIPSNYYVNPSPANTNTLTTIILGVRCLAANGSVSLALYDSNGNAVTLTGATGLNSGVTDQESLKTITVTTPTSPVFTPGTDLTAVITMTVTVNATSAYVSSLEFQYQVQ